MTWRWLGALVVGGGIATPTVGCAADDGGATEAGSQAGDCVELLRFRDQSELARIEPLPHGYVLDGFGRLVAYEIDDTPRFEIPGHDLVFRTTDDGRVLVVDADDTGLRLDAWSSTGELLGEVGRIDGAPMETGRPHVAIAPDGGLYAWGGGFPQWWEGSSTAGLTFSETTEVRDMVVLDDGRHYVLTSTILDPQGIDTREELSLRAATGQTQWTVLLAEGNAAERPSVRVATLIDDQLVLYVTHSVGTEDVPVQLETRWYDTAGTVARRTTTSYVPQHDSPPLPIRLPDGTLVEVDKSGPDLGTRVFGDADAIVCEQHVEANEGFALSELAFVDDVLLVVTIDRITHLRLNHASILE